MKLAVTRELIPITRYPRQGTIIGDVLDISNKRIEVGVHTYLTKTFFDIGDAVPIIIRSHIHEEIEIELEANVLDISEVKKNESNILLEINSENKEIRVVENILEKMNDDNEIVEVFESRIS